MTVRVVVDAMGGDHAPVEIVRGSVEAARRLDVLVTLAGPPATLAGVLAEQGPHPTNLDLLPADEVIGMDEQPASAVRTKRDSSIVVGLRRVKDGYADAFVSAGNTGAVMAAAVLVLGRIKGVERPALGTVFPTSGGGRVLLLDVGANPEPKSAYLLQAAMMGKAYAAGAMLRADPRIGLLSIGEEASKGSGFIQEVHAALAASRHLNFTGNVEGNTLVTGGADVVVTDGFTGNVAIKVAEGAAEFILAELRATLTSKLRYRLAAAVLRPALRGLRSRIDYTEYGGAPLLGVDGVTIVAHGRSNARAVYNAIRVARDAAQGNVVRLIAEAMGGSKL
jgi:glycerol-3-phosphate acyltransferase PlsX